MNTTRVKLSTYHFLLLISIVLLPFTELRLSFFGLSEVILMLAFIYELNKATKKRNFREFVFTKFCSLFILIISLSLLLNLIIQAELDTISGLVFDYASYLFVLLSCFVFEKAFVHTSINTYLMIKYLFFISSLCFAFLFLFSFFSNSIFGLELFYHHRFSPLADNPHKIAIVLLVLPFLGFKIISIEKSLVVRIIILCLIILDIIMIIKTGTSKGLIGVLLGSIIYFQYKVVSNKVLRKFFYLLLFVTILFGVLIGNVGNLLMDYFIIIDGGGARHSIYGKGLMIVFDNLLIGKGPGPHVFHDGHFMDSHQTFLTVLLQGGIFAAFSFTYILFKLYRKIKYNHIFLCLYVAIFIYVLGGDIMRWNFVWIIYIIIYNYRESDELNYDLSRQRNVRTI